MQDRLVQTTGYSLGDAPPQPDARRGEDDRHLTLLRVGALMIGDRRELCLIRNVSAGGMMIRAYSKIAIGTRLSVELKQGDRVEGLVKWVKEDSVGIAFDAPIDIVSLIAASADGPRPRMPRVELCCGAWIRQDATVCRANGVNISQGGLGIETPIELDVGGEVIASLAGLPPLPGVVKWKDGDRYGVGFNRVLAVGELMTFLMELRQRVRAVG